MEIIFVLLSLSVLLASIGLGGYFWSVRSEQFEDLDGPAVRMLSEDDQDVINDSGN